MIIVGSLGVEQSEGGCETMMVAVVDAAVVGLVVVAVLAGLYSY